jgi:uncharacterized protein YbjT (DUF2867 family)
VQTAESKGVILLTGANGTTGHAIIRHLVKRGATVRGLVRSKTSAATIEALGARAHIGNLRDVASLDAAFAAVDRVYHLPPGLQPDELDIAKNVIGAAQRARVRLFGYHSVSYPQLPAVRFHWEKLKAETEILYSGLTFFIVRPCQYMQNVRWSMQRILDEGVFALPWSPDRKMVSVDVEDMGEAIAILLTQSGFEGGTYEFCSVERPLTRHEMAEHLSTAFKRRIIAGQKPIAEALQAERFKHYTPDQLEQMSALFSFFNLNGTPGFNNRTLAMILGREPTTYAAFARRLAAEMGIVS